MAISGLQAIPGNASVTGAIRDAARSTGASFDYLLATARAESGLNPKASAGTSSARGLFQFIDRTWLATLKHAGPGLGYGRYADAISQDANGHYRVADPVMRQQISALRDDPAANAAMAGAFTRQNAGQLEQTLGRAPTDGELYMAHFLGASGAGRLITLASNNPATAAADAFPKAAAANPSIFYDHHGVARSADQVYAALSRRFEMARSGGHAVAAMQPPPPLLAPGMIGAAPAVQAQTVAAVAPAPTVPRMPVAPRSLFNDISGGARTEPVAQIVRELWATRPHIAAALSGTTMPVTSALDSGAVSPPGPADGLRSLYRDLPPNARALFTTRS